MNLRAIGILAAACSCCRCLSPHSGRVAYAAPPAPSPDQTRRPSKRGQGSACFRALQDRFFDTSLLDGAQDMDQALAWRALFEGDAMLSAIVLGPIDVKPPPLLDGYRYVVRAGVRRRATIVLMTSWNPGTVGGDIAAGWRASPSPVDVP